ncbi:MAG: hypothetical protein ACLRIS_02130 [Flavonifractor plautii]
MELELDRTQRSGYEAVLDTAVCREETLESIVPDACPDIFASAIPRAWYACGTRCSRMVGWSSPARYGRRCSTSRTVKRDTPDGGGTALFLYSGAPGADSLCRVVALPRVQGADAWLINPRKVLVRVDLAFCVQVYAPVEDDIYSGVLAPEEAGVQQMSEQCDACTTVCVQEKPFTFSDEISLSGSKPEAEELLKCRAALRCSESRSSETSLFSGRPA